MRYFDPDGTFRTTDRRMFAFRRPRDLPPVIASLSQKALPCGIVAAQRLIGLIRSRGSTIDILGRFLMPEVDGHSKVRVDKVQGHLELRLFVEAYAAILRKSSGWLRWLKGQGRRMLDGGANSRGHLRLGAGTTPALGTKRWVAWAPRLALLSVFTALAAFVFATQNRFVGFEPGYDELQPRHHGWVSSHGLAIMSHATLENGFVGYALAYAEPDGSIRYEYFDRYPVFFSAAMNRVLSITDRLSSKVYIAKQVMNLIFLLTMLVSFLVVDKLICNKPAALAAAVLAMSSEYLLFYKDMVHFDQPALLGMMILTYTIAMYSIDGRRSAPLAGTAIGVCLGRGYVSVFVLATWLAVEWIIAVLGHPGERRGAAAVMLAHPATRAFALGISLSCVLLLYNVGVEVRQTGEPLFETGIVTSAETRLGFNEAFSARHQAVAAWHRFLGDQLDRMIRWSLPLRKPGGETLGNLGIGAVMVALLVLQGGRWDRSRRLVVVVMVTSPLLWMIVMRYMSAPHDYTTMYYLGVSLAVYASLFSLLRLNSRPILSWGALGIALVLFVLANQHTQDLHKALEKESDPAGQLSQFTWDMMAIREHLPESGAVIALSSEPPNSYLAFGFYLPEHFLGTMANADYVIVRDPAKLQENLTPENKRLYLGPTRADE